MNFRSSSFFKHPRLRGRGTSDSLDFAWAAGLADGDGKITVTRASRRICPAAYRIELTVISRNPAVLARFRSIISEHCRLRRSRTSRSTEPVCYALDYRGPAAKYALVKMYEFLLVQRRSAEFAIACACVTDLKQSAVAILVGLVRCEIDRWFRRFRLRRA